MRKMMIRKMMMRKMMVKRLWLLWGPQQEWHSWWLAPVDGGSSEGKTRPREACNHGDDYDNNFNYDDGDNNSRNHDSDTLFGWIRIYVDVIKSVKRGLAKGWVGRIWSPSLGLQVLCQVELLRYQWRGHRLSCHLIMNKMVIKMMRIMMMMVMMMMMIMPVLCQVELLRYQKNKT